MRKSRDQSPSYSLSLDEYMMRLHLLISRILEHFWHDINCGPNPAWTWLLSNVPAFEGWGEIRGLGLSLYLAFNSTSMDGRYFHFLHWNFFWQCLPSMIAGFDERGARCPRVGSSLAYFAGCSNWQPDWPQDITRSQGYSTIGPLCREAFLLF